MPYFLFKAWTDKKYWQNLPARLGFFKTLESNGFEKVLWVHAVSVGETLACKPLISLIKRQHPSWQVILSTTTLTGHRLAREQLRPPVDEIIYFPIDLPFAVRRAVARTQPDLVMVAETEIWPNFLRECARRDIPCVLVNGRLSTRSFRRYRWVRRFMQDVLHHFDLLLAQSNDDAERLRALGAPDARLQVIGNMKYDIQPSTPAAAASLHQLVKDSLGIDKGGVLLLAGSTVDGEDKIILSTFVKLKAKHKSFRLILAPRHPERFSLVEQLINRLGLKYARRSRLGDGVLPREAIEVLLLDTMGELAGLYELADLVFIGGSLVPKGGHNIIEPALYAKPILFGPYTQNFSHIVKTFLDEHAAVEARDPDHLLTLLDELLIDPRARAQLGRNARAIIERNGGATQRTLACIERLL
ncbi:MAG: 3-deoxy-D-manno-octulosonic acid transferase [Acidobacteria bacterium]|nr:3-deoxy-D-manno-octulosonic acid transferase [Acidobacteriota bacterium]